MHFVLSGRRTYALLMSGVSIFVLVCRAEVLGASTRSASGRARANISSSHKKTAAISTGCAPCAAGASSVKKGSSRQAKARIPCHPSGYVDPHISKNLNNAIRGMKRSGITPQITSAWRSKEEQQWLYNCSNSPRCRKANPWLYSALPPGHSLHEAAFAVDISGVAAGRRGAKRITPRGRRIVRIMRQNGFQWRYGLADPAHFEANPQTYGYRTVKQAIKRSQTTCQAKLIAASAPAPRTKSLSKSRTRETARTSGKVAVYKRQSQRG